MRNGKVSTGSQLTQWLGEGVHRSRLDEAICLGVLLDEVTAVLRVAGGKGRLSGDIVRLVYLHFVVSMEMWRRRRQAMKARVVERRHGGQVGELSTAGGQTNQYVYSSATSRRPGSAARRAAALSEKKRSSPLFTSRLSWIESGVVVTGDSSEVGSGTGLQAKKDIGYFFGGGRV
jgi:hypothetical protein